MFYRVLRDWEDRSSPIGTFTLLENAVLQAQLNPGYKVYDEDGKQVFPEQETANGGDQ